MSLSSKITYKGKGELVRTLYSTFPVKPSLVPQSWSECFSRHSDDFVKVASAPGEEQSACLKVSGQIAAQGKPSRAGSGKPEAWTLSLYLGWTAVLAGSK